MGVETRAARTYYSGANDGVRWGQASGDCKARNESKAGEENPEEAWAVTLCQQRVQLYRGTDRTSNDNPAYRHGGYDHDKKAFGVASHVRFRQLDPNGEQTCSEDDTHDFESYRLVVISPVSWIEYPGELGPHEDSKRSTEHDFINIDLAHDP